MLYMGYVGFGGSPSPSPPLMTGRPDATWARWSRPGPWRLGLPLTLGIVPGSWWACYELGWGGWWFWDPVENASFMPLAGGHGPCSTPAVSEKRHLQGPGPCCWRLGLLLSLLGPSGAAGVLVSVHAFASDLTRGPLHPGLPCWR